MARILVLYGTSAGHTEKVSTIIANTLTELGCDVDVFQAGTVDPAITHYDGIIVAASIHGGRFQSAVVDAIRGHAAEIAAKPNALVQVCLSVLKTDDPAAIAGLDAMIRHLADDSGWNPATVKRVAGAMPYTKFNLLTRWVVKQLIGKSSGLADTSRDYVTTDWDDVKAFAREFGRRFTTAAA